MVDPWGVVASVSLIAVTVALSVTWRLDLHRPLVVAALRAVVQLLAVGVILIPVLRSDAELIWSWMWVLAMVALAVGVVRHRTRSSAGCPSLLTATVGVALPLVVCLAVVFGLGVLPLQPIALVPIAGIILGNSHPATVAGATRLQDQLVADRGQIEAMLALGFTPRVAVQRTVQVAIRDALLPQIERTNVVGLVALPGAMTGLILAGVDPIDAVMTQIVVMFLVLGAVGVTATYMTAAGARQAFTSDLRLRRTTP